MSLTSVNSGVESGQLDSTAPDGNQPAAAAIPDPQVVPKAAKAKRRRFSASDKQRILAAVDQATEPGAVGRILRREGIYHSQLSKWRQRRAEGISAGLGRQSTRRERPERKIAAARESQTTT